MGQNEEGGARLSAAPSERSRGNGQKINHVRNHFLSTGKYVFPLRLANTGAGGSVWFKRSWQLSSADPRRITPPRRVEERIKMVKVERTHGLR